MNKFYKDYVLANPCALNDEDIDKLVSHCEKQIMLGYEFNDRKHKEEHETTLKIINEYKRLKQENNQLKERIEYLERSNNRREETILDLRSENVDLATKIDKAIEYLETNGYGYDCCGDMCYFLDEDNQKDLLKILKNGDVDE